MAHESLQPELGVRLRGLRRQRRLKLADVSEATGISASFLSLVESGKNDVTISRLARLCAFYGIGVADVLPPTSTSAADVHRRGEHQHFFSRVEGMDLSVLGTGASVSLFRVDYEPGAHTTEQIASSTEGMLVVTEGRIEVLLDDLDPIPLEQGDSLYMGEGRRRGYRNLDPDQPASMLIVVARQTKAQTES